MDKLLASHDCLKIGHLARKWAPELSVPWEELANHLHVAGVNGEFDELPDGHGLLVIDAISGLAYPTTGVKLRAEQERLAQSTDPAEMAAAQQLPLGLGVHQEAVALFAATRQLKLPSWWGGPTQPASEDAIWRAATIYAETTYKETGKLPAEREVRDAVRVEFHPNRITDSRWRNAWKRVSTKRRRGETNTALPSRGKTPKS
jgi:hypothetical protein